MRKITCRLPAGGGASRLDVAIAQSPEAAALKLSRGLIRKLIVAGAVYVNGKRVRVASRALHGGEIIDLYWDSKRATPGTSAAEGYTAEKFLPLRVLYEDEAVICFDKPAGLPTQPTLDEARVNLYELAKRQLAHADGATAAHAPARPVYLGLHHRLDRDTSGVVLFTRDKKYNAFIADQFRAHKIAKLYVAVVHGKLKQPEGRLESFLAPVGKKGKRAKFGSVRSGGKKAITDYLVLGGNREFTLVEVRIATGRTHQIRVHFSEMGHPVAGDTLYGSDPALYGKAGRHLLHAHALTFEHPVTGGHVRVESPVPQEFRQWVSSKP